MTTGKLNARVAGTSPGIDDDADHRLKPELQALLLRLSFPAPPFEVAGRASIADLVKPLKRCGIYVLHFRNGELYAGRAKDVTRRYVQHRETYDDITHLSFRTVPERHLEEIERLVIRELNATQHTRNVMGTPVPEANCDLDTVFPPSLQDRWLQEVDYIPPITPDRARHIELRRQYRNRYEQFLARPRHAEVVSLLQDYVLTCIPNPTATEVIFWNASCPGKGRLHSRININQQEVMALSGCVTFHMSKRLIEGTPFRQLQSRFRSLWKLSYVYRAGGEDQIGLGIEFPEAGAFLREPKVRQSIREFNLRLMRRGPCMWGRYHCPALADRIFEGIGWESPSPLPTELGFEFRPAGAAAAR